jgi:membrane-associated phospholipid phosphatase
MHVRQLVVAATLFVAPITASAQSVGKMLGDDFSFALKDIWSVWSSPFHAQGKDWALTGATLAAAAAMLPVDKPAERWAQRNENARALRFLDPLRRKGVLFSGKYVNPPAAALYLVGLATKNQGIRDGVMGCAASWGSTGLARRVVYLAVGRERPDTSPDDNLKFSVPNTHGLGEKGWQWRSFPAGHFANVAGCATFLSHRFDMGVVEPALYAVALGVMLGRTLDHGHWMSDNVVGGVMGYAAGSEIARRSLHRRAASAAPGFTVQPNEQGAMVFQFNWKF